MGLDCLGVNHLEAIVRTKVRAYSAMTADYRFFSFFIVVDCAHYAGCFTFSATDAHVFPDQYAASQAFLQSVAWAHLHTCGFLAPKAYYCGEAAGHAADSTYSDRAFYK